VVQLDNVDILLIRTAQELIAFCTLTCEGRARYIRLRIRQHRYCLQPDITCYLQPCFCISSVHIARRPVSTVCPRVHSRDILKKSGLFSARPLRYHTQSPVSNTLKIVVDIGHYIKWASPPTNIIMICIDIQGKEQHCREKQGFWGKPRVEQKELANRNARFNQFERYSCYGRPDWAPSDRR
jgi:hypothetical protein